MNGSPELKASCGKTRNRRGKPFTPHSLHRHQRDCPVCRLENPQPDEEDDDDAMATRDGVFELLDLSDESDGVFFGLWNELGGGY